MNLVITISRRFGTGASLIAQELSEKLGVPVYDKAYIEHELNGDSYATEAEVDDSGYFFIFLWIKRS